jgi:hypothetical protein
MTELVDSSIAQYAVIEARRTEGPSERFVIAYPDEESLRETPLWYYILREADACRGGHRLGPVGGRIVAEVLVGLIDADPTSFRKNSPEWRPKKTLSELFAS